MKIESLNHIAIIVEDVQKTVQFYGEVLELPQIPRPDFNFAGAWFAFGENQELHIIEGRKKPVNFGDRGTHIALAVNSIKDAMAFLDKKEVPYMPPRQRPDGVWQTYFEDPDGYVIEFTELPS